LKPQTRSAWQPRVWGTLHALGGQGTLGDVVALTGLSRGDVERALDELIADERAQVRVTASGDVVYHLGETALGRGPCPPRRRPEESLRREDALRATWAGFDRKTLQLIRAREGVISLAELIEHTGLPLRDAREEMRRLAESYGGAPYASLDGHVVHAFPDLMASAHGFPTREPRPAWVRFEDPIRASRIEARRERLVRALNAAGLVAAAAAPWLLWGASPSSFLFATAICAVGVVVFGRNLRRSIGWHRLFRFKHARSVRRYLLGLVIQTALAGKGVVSLGRAVDYVKARAGKRRVSRASVEAALRDLAVEFEAPITETDGEIFFGFRNIKRQFLASHVVRREMRLGRTAQGSTVFDTADSPLAAAQRELDSFDRELWEGRAG
jgi:hypothetical protein